MSEETKVNVEPTPFEEILAELKKVREDLLLKEAEAANTYVRDSIAYNSFNKGYIAGANATGEAAYKLTCDILEKKQAEYQAKIDELIEVAAEMAGHAFDRGFDIGTQNAEADSDADDWFDGYNSAILDVCECGIDDGVLAPCQVEYIKAAHLLDEEDKGEEDEAVDADEDTGDTLSAEEFWELYNQNFDSSI